MKITQRNNAFSITGTETAKRKAESVVRDLFEITGQKKDPLSNSDVHFALSRSNGDGTVGNQFVSNAVTDLSVSHGRNPHGTTSATAASRGAVSEDDKDRQDDDQEVIIRLRRQLIRGQNFRQKHYLRYIRDNDISFGIGPAGTGKTYLAVASAVQALSENSVERILLVRPAVEAGEKLGFLPGDIGQKIDPYLRPLFDALYEMLGFERVGKLIARGTIELAPLAYMRGRTLNESFVILDEAQNTTVEQMKMFLTRIGFSSKAIITGDVTQVDLPRGQMSGLKHAQRVLVDIKGISFCQFKPQDVVRHPLVQKIVEAYEKQHSEQQANDNIHDRESRVGKNKKPLATENQAEALAKSQVNQG